MKKQTAERPRSKNRWANLHSMVIALIPCFLILALSQSLLVLDLMTPILPDLTILPNLPAFVPSESRTKPTTILTFPKRVAKASEGQILVILETSIPTVFGPLGKMSNSDKRLHELLHDGPYTHSNSERLPSLIATTSGGGMEGATVDLKWDNDYPKHTVMIGRLREAQFHNGDKVTVKDIENAFRAYSTAAGATRSISWKNRVKKIEDLGNRRFRIFFAEPPHDFRHFLTLRLMPPSAFGHSNSRPNPELWSNAKEQKRFNQHPVGTGPYQWVPSDYQDSMIRLRAFSDYHFGRPKILDVEIQSSPSQDVITNEINSGAAHVAVNISRQMATEIGGKAWVLPYLQHSWTYLGFNNSKSSPFREQTLRTAFSHIINQLQLAKQLSDHVEYCSGNSDNVSSEQADIVLLSSPFVCYSPYYDVSIPHPEPSDDQAVRLIQSLPNFRVENDAGRRIVKIKGRNGWTRWTPEVVIDGKLPDANKLSTLLQEQLNGFGIQAAVKVISTKRWGSFTDPTQKSNYDMFVGEWTFQDSRSNISYLFKSKSPYNIYRYQSESLDGIFREYAHSGNPDSRQAAMYRASAFIAKELPVLVLWQSNKLSAVSTDLKNFGIGSSSYFQTPYRWEFK